MTATNPDLAAALKAMPLVDHHVHSVLKDPMAEAQLLDALTEADHPIDRQTTFDTQVGFAIRRYCAPVLGLAPFATPDEYLARREELGFEEVTRLLLSDAGIGTYLIDGGYNPQALLPVERMMELAGGARAEAIIRLETTAEAVMAASSSGADFVARLYPALEAAAVGAVGWKTVAAYRTGLDLDPAKPTDAELAEAVEAWFAAGSPGAPARLVDRAIVRHLIWWALERGDVVQVHAGFGNTNLHLPTANPAVMQRFVAATQHTGGRIVFLHCYPFLREAGYLAQVYPHVYLDAGLTINYLGANADAAVRETLDLAPFTKVLFSSDAWGAPELVQLGARLWRDATARVLSDYMSVHRWPLAEAIRVAELVAWRNAEALYRRAFPSGR
ncbi:amidohydrolase family protein [Microbacterium sp. CPCC 204701]|uniref:amidohydrolase family protein n=1 Tax=Microbacterium sp. CPCC 204701 TaxID=2493084 RepID=UPI000FD8D090|nr:amidohydrolase family protein [Microbacterium sp. CPCC 204701]